MARKEWLAPFFHDAHSHHRHALDALDALLSSTGDESPKNREHHRAANPTHTADAPRAVLGVGLGEKEDDDDDGGASVVCGARETGSE